MADVDLQSSVGSDVQAGGGGRDGVSLELVRVEESGRHGIDGHGPMSGHRRGPVEPEAVVGDGPVERCAVGGREGGVELLLGEHVAAGPDEVLQCSAEVVEPALAGGACHPSGVADGFTDLGSGPGEDPHGVGEAGLHRLEGVVVEAGQVEGIRAADADVAVAVDQPVLTARRAVGADHRVEGGEEDTPVAFNGAGWGGGERALTDLAAGVDRHGVLQRTHDVDVLAVVAHQDPHQDPHVRGGDAEAAHTVGDVSGPRRRGDQEVAAVRVGEPVDQLGGDLLGEAGLADPAGAGHRDQPLLGGEATQLDHLGDPPDQRGRRAREVVAELIERPQRGEAVGEIGMDQLPHPFGAGQVAQAVHAEIADRGVGGEMIGHQPGGDVRQQHLAPISMYYKGKRM